jgi:hypothetical protein
VWIKQCVVTKSGFSSFKREVKLLMERTNYWWSTISTDAYTVLRRGIFCFQIWRQDIKYTLPFAYFWQLFAIEKVSFNITIIYKSYKCYNINFLVKSVDSLTWIEKWLFFSLSHKTSSSSSDMPSIRPFIVLWKFFNFSYCILSQHFTNYNFTCSHY